MMRGIFDKAALLLLPLLVHALVLPNDIVGSESQQDALGYIFDSPPYGGPSTFLEYDIDDHSIKFAIPCPYCSNEEKDLLGQKIISIKPTLQNTASCTSLDPIGLEIDGKPVVSTGESTLALQSHIGPLDLTDHSGLDIFNRIRWINHCGCIDGHGDAEQCDGHFESSFSLEVLGLPSGEIPGFTLSYTQYRAPKLTRLSTFPDIGIADSWRFGQSAHYRSPVLRLQKALRPSPTLVSLSSSSSSFPSSSSTTSAHSPSYTYLGHTTKNPTSSIVGISSAAGYLKQSPSLDIVSPDHTGLEDCDSKNPSQCHSSDALAGLVHGLESVGMKAKSRAAAFLGKFQVPLVPSQAAQAFQTSSPVAVPTSSPSRSHQASQTSPPETVPTSLSFRISSESKDDPIVIEEVAHDELGDEYTQSQPDRVEDFLMLDLPLTSWKVDNSVAVKAFQVTSLVFIVVALAGSLATLVCRNPRLRAQWATVLEERRNRRLYRQAACKRRFQTFFNRFGSSSAAERASASIHHTDTTLDWQGWEKRTSLDSTIYDQKIDSGALRQDLLAFRKAHQFVDGLISAKEGRSSSSRQTHRERLASRVRHQRTWSFGSEKTAPPAYESEGEDLILDADGPRYVVLRRGFAKSDNSPDSSVISTSPRTSCADSDSEPDEKF